MNMIQERYLIWGSRELAIIIVTLVQITCLMAKFEVYDIKTIVRCIVTDLAGGRLKEGKGSKRQLLANNIANLIQF